MTRDEEMMREARKHYDISTFLDGVKWAYEHPKSYTIAEYLYKEKGYPISINGDIPTYEEVVKHVQADKIEKACDGVESTDAEPNLESLWHDASEEPQGDNWRILCVDDYDLYWMAKRAGIIGLFNNWEEYVVIEGVKMWAYISDLLPKQFRKTKSDKW